MKAHVHHMSFLCMLAACMVWVRPVFAEYVLPYPAYMPGNKLYTISRLIDRYKAPFYFGNISSYKYHLALADKYIVEAKTLFEYKQYLLASDALTRSDAEFAVVSEYLLRARREKKDVHTFEVQLREASVAHTQILRGLSDFLPPVFVWEPEKSAAIELPLADMVRESLMVRENAVIRLP